MNNFKADYVKLAKKAQKAMLVRKAQGFYALAAGSKKSRDSYMMLARAA